MKSSRLKKLKPLPATEEVAGDDESAKQEWGAPEEATEQQWETTQ